MQKQVLLQTLLEFFCALAYGILLQTNDSYANLVPKNSYSVCQSEQCIHHANLMIKNMDLKVNPCQDFYSFACGGYKKKFGENDTRSVYDDTWQLLQKQAKDMLENLRPEEGSSSHKLKTVYENCMDVESSEKKSVLDAVNFLNDMGIPNWPHLSEDFHFLELSDSLGKLASYDEFAFLSLKSSQYPTNLSDSNIHPPILVLQGNFLLNSKRKPNDVYESVKRILKYFNISKNEIENIWKEFVEIENAGMRLQNDESENPLECKGTHRTAHKEVNCSRDTFGSMKFICNVWSSSIKASSLAEFYSTDIIHIPCSRSHFHYLNNIDSYLGKTTDRSLANYLALRFFISHLDDLNAYFHQTKRTYPEDKRSRISEPLSRWEYCIGWIVKSMNSALGYEYTQRILTKTTENSVLDIIKDYVQELDTSISGINWLTERIKSYLRKQLGNLDIGFGKTLAKYRNKTFVESLYKMFYPQKGSFLKNILDYQKMLLVSKEKPSFNNFYTSSDPYTMDFGLALLQPPTFVYGLPKLWNYATLGFVIGHELSHNLKFFFDFVYLDEKSENYLNEKLQCYAQQYSQILAKKTARSLISTEVKEEIIADNLGWELTERIITKIINNENNEVMKLPGLDYTPLQSAYISFAQDSCAVLSKDVEAELFMKNPQHLPYLRIFGVLQNSKLFSETFNCSKGEYSNPGNKCTFF